MHWVSNDPDVSVYVSQEGPRAVSKLSPLFPSNSPRRHENRHPPDNARHVTLRTQRSQPDRYSLRLARQPLRKRSRYFPEKPAHDAVQATWDASIYPLTAKTKHRMTMRQLTLSQVHGLLGMHLYCSQLDVLDGETALASGSIRNDDTTCDSFAIV